MKAIMEGKRSLIHSLLENSVKILTKKNSMSCFQHSGSEFPYFSLVFRETDGINTSFYLVSTMLKSSLLLIYFNHFIVIKKIVVQIICVVARPVWLSG